MKIKTTIALMALLIIGLPLNVTSEVIANYNNCDVCHGAIRFDPEEVRGMLGHQGHDLIKVMPGDDYMLTLDAHGAVMENKAEGEGVYEISITGKTSVLYIKDVRDGSLIRFMMDKNGAKNGFEVWQPLMFAESTRMEDIELSDDVATGWRKFSSSSISAWFGNTPGDVLTSDKLGHGLIKAMELVHAHNSRSE